MEKGIYDGNTEQYEHLIQDGYSFHLGDYIRKGWEIFTEKGWGFFGFSILLVVISGVVSSIFTSLSVNDVNFLGTIAQTVIGGALAAGYFVVADKIHHGEKTDFGDFFKGFEDWAQIAYAQLLILVFTIAIGAAFAGHLFVTTDIWEIYNNLDTNPEAILPLLTSPKFIGSSLLVILAYLYISMAYWFTIPLIIFGRLKFWDAMETSRKIITRNFFSFLLLYVVMIGIAFLSIFVFIIGIFAAQGFMYCVSYAAYADIVGIGSTHYDSQIDEIGSDME